jgi:hypothetical protein
MKIKDKYSNEIICSDLLVEHNDCFSKTILKDCKCLTVIYHKNIWEKINDKDDYLRLILKDFNKLHMFGFYKIEQIYDGTDLIIFRLYSSDFKTSAISYDKDTRTMYFNCCKIESDDLKSSIESYLSLLNKE